MSEHKDTWTDINIIFNILFYDIGQKMPICCFSAFEI